MATGNSLADEAYIAFTTFTKDGRAKSAPVWIADLGDGSLGFTTAGSSYKVKRLRNNPACTLQPSDRRGTVLPGTEPTSGTATVSTSELSRVQRKIRAKYGFQSWLIGTLGKIASLFGTQVADTAVIVTVDDTEASSDEGPDS